MNILIISDRTLCTSLGKTARHIHLALKEIYNTELLFLVSDRFFKTKKSIKDIENYNSYRCNNFYIGATIKFKNFIKKIEHKYDLIILSHQFLGYLVSSIDNNKILTMVHDIFSITLHKNSIKYYLLNKFLLSPITKSRAFLYNSNSTKNEFEKYFKISKPNIVTYVVIEPKEILHFNFNNNIIKKKDKQKIFLNIGLPEKRKNNKMFIDLSKQFPNDIFLRIGEFTKNENIKAKKIKNLILMKNLSFNDLLSLYKLSDYYILPSTHEGFSMTGLEALLLGTKTIVSNIPVHKEVYGDLVEYASNEIGIKSYIEKIKTVKEIPQSKAIEFMKKYELESFEYRLVSFIESLRTN